MILYLINIDFPTWIEISLDVFLIGIVTPAIICTGILVPTSNNETQITSKTSRLKSNVWFTYTAVIISLSLLMMTNYKIHLESFEKDLLKKEVHMINLVDTQLYDYLYHSKLDLLMLANQAELQDFTKTDKQILQKYYSSYINLLEIKDYYMQVRYIDAKGNEIVRIERKNNKISVVNQLQNKSDRYYFRNTKKLRSGNIYISPLDLNVKHEQVVKPFQPMIRLATPIY